MRVGTRADGAVSAEPAHARRNFGSVTSGEASSNVTSTGMPTRIVLGGQSMRFEVIFGPSASFTSTTAYGTSSAKPGW